MEAGNMDAGDMDSDVRVDRGLFKKIRTGRACSGAGEAYASYHFFFTRQRFAGGYCHSPGDGLQYYRFGEYRDFPG